MWSAVNSEYVRDLAMTMANDYRYYIAHTISDDTSTVSTNRITLRVYFSTKPFVSLSAYSYRAEASAETIYFNVRGNGYSSNQSHMARMEKVNLSNVNISIPNYEFIYASRENTGTIIHPDIIYEGRSKQHEIGATNMLLCIALLFSVFINIFRRR